MATKYSNTNANIYPKNNYYLLSSWNYGSYSPSNPFYKSHFNSKKENLNTNPNTLFNKKTFPRSTTTTQLTSANTPYRPSTKRRLKEEERIVTNELLDCFNHYNKMQKHLKKGTFRPKSVNRIINSKIIKDNCNESKNLDKNIKKLSDTSEYKYKLTFTEWISVKNKQREIFNNIVKKQKEKEEILEEANKKIDIKYQEVKEQKFKEWIKRKNSEILKKKKKDKIKEIEKEELKKQKEEKKEEIMNNWFKIQAEKMEKEIFEKKQKEERKEEIMNNWFKIQARKMEKELLEKREKILMEKEKANLKKIEKQQKQMLNKKAFKEWKERKEKEIKKRKIEEKKKKQREEEKKKRDLLKKRVKSFTIGPYTDAAALKEVQNYLVENNLNKEEEDMYFQNNSEF